MKAKVVGAVFVTSWILCGCSLETMFDNPINAAISVFTAITAVSAALVLANAWRK